MLFQTDRFISLMMGAPYAVSDTDCNSSPKVGKHMLRLAVLVGKVIDHTKSPGLTSYLSVLETDKELIDFSSQMLKDPWRHPPRHMPLPKTSRKSPEVELPVLIFNQARLMLHLPWMLKSLTEAGLEYSQSGCFEAARAIIQLFKDNRLTDDHFSGSKCAPIDLITFVAAATLCLGQFGYAPGTEDASVSKRDEELIESAMAGFKRMRTIIASQSIENLHDLIKLQNEWSRGESVPSKISIPLIGEVIIPALSIHPFEGHFPVDMVGSIAPHGLNPGVSVNPIMPQTSIVEPVDQTLNPAGQINFSQAWVMPYSTPFDLANFTLVPHGVEGGFDANCFQGYRVGPILLK
jgi:hypothetical protein